MHCTEPPPPPCALNGLLRALRPLPVNVWDIYLVMPGNAIKAGISVVVPSRQGIVEVQLLHGITESINFLFYSPLPPPLAHVSRGLTR